MKVKIISDGTPQGTKVYNKETGEELKLVTGITIHAYPDYYKAEITQLITDVEFQTEAEIKQQIL